MHIIGDSVETWTGVLLELPKELQRDISKALAEDLDFWSSREGGREERVREALAEIKRGLLQIGFRRYTSHEKWEVYWAWCFLEEFLGNEEENPWAKGSPEKPWKWEKIFK